MGNFISSSIGATLCIFVLATTIHAASAQPANSRAEVIDIRVANEQFEFVDLGAPGVGVGDMYVFSDRLFQNGQPFGQDGGSCQVAGVSGTTIVTNCVMSIRAWDGQITVQALWNHGSNPLEMAITGGTGRYENARGHLRATDIGTPNEAYRLELSY
ncbi:hypothetical protein LVJ94_16995 [Pendulispora rubella]|uniref:Allene oxide cyclase barrel-like domain-containing protein n=1 Tax=Pendulispora rubella TaxID=2741070 RepID=A0ABZ2LEX0_9BACT